MFFILAVLLPVCRAPAWSAPGHMVIAAEAWRALSPKVRERAVELLKSPPEFANWQRALEGERAPWNRAIEIETAHPRKAQHELNKARAPKDWTLESRALAIDKAYLRGNLKGSADRDSAPNLPADYSGNSNAVAERQAALAGYRDLLPAGKTPEKFQESNSKRSLELAHCIFSGVWFLAV